MSVAVGSPTFEQELAQRNLSGARLGYVLSAVLMPAGFALDWVLVPTRVGELFPIRAISCVVALALLALTWVPAARRYPVLLGAGPPFVCGAGIEAMIIRLGGVESAYYAGICLCILAVAVLYNWRLRDALLVSLGLLALWATPDVPRLIRGGVDLRVAFGNFYFLALTTVISVSSTVIRYRSARREFDARHRAESTSAELEDTLLKLRELDRMKNEFFANVSHELRTPLTLIFSPVEQLLATTTDEGQRAALGIIHRNAQRLLRLIEDLLDLARLDAGGLRLRVAELDLEEILRRVVGGAKPTATAKGLTLELEIAQVPTDTWGDPHRIDIIVTNLVGNALKFTPSGGHVRVELSATATGARVQVRDDGEGIAPEDHERIFDRFYQVEGSTRRRHGGAGIGLALARELAQLHGGQLSVESERGSGATFTLDLPLGREHLRRENVERRSVTQSEHPGRRMTDRATDEPQAPPPVAPSRNEAPIRLERGRRPRVLVVEDEADLREFLVRTLSNEFDVVAAADGASALVQVREVRPDLVLTDVMMPTISGTDLCRAIKGDPSTANTPVILVTARSGTDATLEGYASGADDFVTKPFHASVLEARIRAHLRLRALGLALANRARLTTAGVLGAGIAHEVKNPINAIVNAARALEKDDNARVPREKLLSLIVEGAQRISDVVSVLEEHVRPAEAGASAQEKNVCDVSVGLDASVRLLAHVLGSAQIHQKYSASRMVSASARQLNQVFLNLLHNAARVKPENVWIDTRDTSSGVEISIADDGPGVPPDVVGLLFDPFFPSVEPGGSGLGLFLCHQIVNQAGGEISYRPRTGGGAEFIVRLPALEAAA
jgi:signal transduction histidine kinase